MGQNMAFLPLMLVLLLAFLVPLLLARVRWLPVVVGEILAGLLIGRSGLDLVRGDITLDFLSEIGLALLMFLAGLEIDFSRLSQAVQSRARRFLPVALALSSFTLTLVLAGLLSSFLFTRGMARDPWILTLILSTTSLGVVVPVLKERGLSGGLFGQALILAALVADFATMFLITVYVAIRSRGLSLDILLTGILFVAALLVYRIGSSRIRRSRLSRVVEDIGQAATQAKVHGAIALLVGFVILAKFVGSEMILGAFLAGVVLSLMSHADERTRSRLEAIGFGFFIPIFFITVGLRFDLPSLLRYRTAWSLALILLGAGVALKVLPALVFRAAFSWRRTLAAGILLSARLSLIIAAAGIGLQIGAVDETTHAALILIAAVTSTAVPLVFNAVLPEAGEKKERLIGIFGRNDIGLQVAAELEQRGERVVFVDPPSALPPDEPPLLKNFEVVGGGGERTPWTGFDHSKARALIVLDVDDDRNLSMCEQALGYGLKHLIALVNAPARLPEFHAIGVQTLTPARFRATLLALMAHNPDLFQILTSAREEHQIREIELEAFPAGGRRLADIGFGADVLVLSVRKGEDVVIPHGSTRLDRGDHVTVLGTAAALDLIADRLGRLEESL
jgi:Kef-type K+ transport system membrane component KefB/Trk K+ transport system NAD-binding subunit